MPQKRVCPFCGRLRQPSGEHFWPEWFSQAHPEPGFRKASFEHEALYHPVGGYRPRRKTGKVGTYKVLLPCIDCNSEWMGQIEDRAKPIIIEIGFRGQERQLTVGDQRCLAAWAVIRALVADANDAHPAVLPDVYRWLHKRRTPPFGYRVSIARQSFDGWGTFIDRRAWLDDAPPKAPAGKPPPRVIQVVVSIRHLALIVVGRDDAPLSAMGMAANLRTMLRIYDCIGRTVHAGILPN